MTGFLKRLQEAERFQFRAPAFFPRTAWATIAAVAVSTRPDLERTSRMTPFFLPDNSSVVTARS
jgi:hypothetical protein